MSRRPRLIGCSAGPGRLRTPSIRAMIELRLGDEIIARAVADQPRPDLASNGVGDGRHAFEIAVPNDYRARIAELRVFARSGDGEALPIGAPPAAEGLSEQMAKAGTRGRRAGRVAAPDAPQSAGRPEL